MKATAAQHTGLPFVPQPAPDELLGSWLLGLAQLYGLGMTTLLIRLGALPAGDARIARWFAVNGSNVSLDVLAGATRMPRPALAAMTPSTRRPRWPGELGACARCLSHATGAGEPITWNRNWMNPLATVCRIHGTWPRPVATRMLASIYHVEDFGGVAQHAEAAQRLLDCELPCVGDALWLQDLCNARTDVSLPWGSTRPNDLTRIVDWVARTLISASAAHRCGCPACPGCWGRGCRRRPTRPASRAAAARAPDRRSPWISRRRPCRCPRQRCVECPAASRGWRSAGMKRGARSLWFARQCSLPLTLGDEPPVKATR